MGDPGPGCSVLASRRRRAALPASFLLKPHRPFDMNFEGMRASVYHAAFGEALQPDMEYRIVAEGIEGTVAATQYVGAQRRRRGGQTLYESSE